MSSPVRIAFVVEGPTDYAILNKIVENFLGRQDFEPISIQPELSETMQIDPEDQNTGWSGVYYWCRQMSGQIPRKLADDVRQKKIDLLLFLKEFDLLILHLDADVAHKTYASANIMNPPEDAILPCYGVCPPASNSTNALRAVILQWLDEARLPAKIVLCTPSKATDVWVAIGLFHTRTDIAGVNNIECKNEPYSLLRSKPAPRRLVTGNEKHIDKYREFAPEVAENWQIICDRCNEAQRFSDEFCCAIAPILARM